ncbi:MAG: pentapeptide repeat-containing protein, partial [Desulfomonilaceae bacterium]
NTRFAQTYMNNTNFSGADLRGVIFDTSAFENADFRGANLQGVKYDSIALGFFAVSKLDGAKMSEDLKSDLEKLRSGKTT